MYHQAIPNPESYRGRTGKSARRIASAVSDPVSQGGINAALGVCNQNIFLSLHI